MSNLEKFKIFFGVIQEATHKEYFPDTNTIHLNQDETVDSQLAKIQVESTEINNNLIEIPLDQFDSFNCYWDDKDFLSSCTSLNKFNKDVGVLNTNYNTARFFSKDKDYSILNFKDNQPEYLLINAKKYWEFIDFLYSRNNDHEESDSGFQFLDYFSKDTRKLFFHDLKHGKMVFKSYKYPPDFTSDQSFARKIERFKNCFSDQNKHLPKFLKVELITFLKNVKKQDRLTSLFTNMNQIIDSAEINFEVYLSELSIENIKKNYEEYKHTFFDESSKVLGKLTNKVIGLPVIISATLFGISKVSDSNLGILFLILSIFVTSYYLGMLLKISVEDLYDIKKTMNRSFSELKSFSFFQNRPEELISFRKSKDKLLERSALITKLINNYFWILFLSNLALILYALSYLIDYKKYMIVPILGGIAGAWFVSVAHGYFLRIPQNDGE